MALRIYQHSWTCEETGLGYSFEINSMYFPQTYWYPEEESIELGTYYIDDEIVDYPQFLEQSGWDHSDMMQIKYLVGEPYEYDDEYDAIDFP